MDLLGPQPLDFQEDPAQVGLTIR